MGANRRSAEETQVATEGKEEARMDSVGEVAESNDDGQAPGGLARGTPGSNEWGGEALWEEGNTVDSSGGEERG